MSIKKAIALNFTAPNGDTYFCSHPMVPTIDKKNNKFTFPLVYVHSHNPIGAHNICGLINNFLKNEKQPQNCVRVQIPHTV